VRRLLCLLGLLLAVSLTGVAEIGYGYGTLQITNDAGIAYDKLVLIFDTLITIGANDVVPVGMALPVVQITEIAFASGAGSYSQLKIIGDLPIGATLFIEVGADDDAAIILNSWWFN